MQQQLLCCVMFHMVWSTHHVFWFLLPLLLPEPRQPLAQDQPGSGEGGQAPHTSPAAAPQRHLQVRLLISSRPGRATACVACSRAALVHEPVVLQ